MFTTIVAPLDEAPEGRRSLPVVRAAAAAFSAEVEVVHAVPELLAPHAESVVATLRESLDEQGITGHVQALAGDDVEVVIARWVADRPAPLVVIATTSGGAAKNAVLGSSTERLMHLLAAPALLVGRRVEADAAHDGPVVVWADTDQPYQRSIDMARAWAGRTDVGLRVVAVDSPETGVDDDAAVVAARWADALGDGVPHEVLHERRRPQAVAEHAAEVDAAVVVATTRARVGAKRLLAGAPAFALAGAAPCPVLVHHPFTIVAEAESG